MAENLFQTRVKEVAGTVKKYYGITTTNKNLKVEYKWVRLAREIKAKLQEEIIQELKVSAKTTLLAAQLAKGYISIKSWCYLRCLTCK